MKTRLKSISESFKAVGQKLSKIKVWYSWELFDSNFELRSKAGGKIRISARSH